MNILFLCTSNLNRSKTAEDHFAVKDPLRVYRSAGLSEKECKRNSTTLCSEELLEWSDVVFVMEDEHVRRIEQYTGQRFLDKVINLNIPDVYQYGEPALIEQLEKRRDAMQFEELFARIESPSSARAALRLFNVSSGELAATFKPSPTEN
ncbi:hypothetical protein [Pseudoalteromonas sp. Ps84H-4]|uniref:hypothetical protein n=1 Tax=Pseudoalteromonas sp. Ps84H-4 TaxID=2954502 RepID=UPI002098290B|nr:hypothetical protein [Pseudoalteromonas sp. Ps84H-4]MCO7250094.1 hypothetical protein [Pseudoalteromonas sp. Ps84H-4]